MKRPTLRRRVCDSPMRSLFEWRQCCKKLHVYAWTLLASFGLHGSQARRAAWWITFHRLTRQRHRQPDRHQCHSIWCACTCATNMTHRRQFKWQNEPSKVRAVRTQGPTEWPCAWNMTRIIATRPLCLNSALELIIAIITLSCRIEIFYTVGAKSTVSVCCCWPTYWTVHWYHWIVFSFT